MQNNIFFINLVYFFMKTPYFSIFLLFFCRFFAHILCTLHNFPIIGKYQIYFNLNISETLFITFYPKTIRRMEDFLKMRYSIHILNIISF